MAAALVISATGGQPADDPCFETEIREGICIVRFVEPFLRDADRLKRLRQRCKELATKHHRFVINMDVVEYCSSVALGSLVSMRNAVDRSGGRIHLCCVDSHIVEMFNITGLHALFAWFETEAEAIAALAA